ncbi:hypothetical protein Hdeb2414_s0007g00262511 [Helianthus debilis subsp. tardiflorus]
MVFLIIAIYKPLKYHLHGGHINFHPGPLSVSNRNNLTKTFNVRPRNDATCKTPKSTPGHPAIGILVVQFGLECDCNYSKPTSLRRLIYRYKNITRLLLISNFNDTVGFNPKVVNEYYECMGINDVERTNLQNRLPITLSGFIILE